MKLYTENQVKSAIIDFVKNDYILNYPNLHKSINTLTPIKLPSDDEIDEESPYVPNDASIDFWSHKEGFVDGAKWMRDKIQGGNK